MFLEKTFQLLRHLVRKFSPDRERSVEQRNISPDGRCQLLVVESNEIVIDAGKKLRRFRELELHLDRSACRPIRIANVCERACFEQSIRSHVNPRQINLLPLL
jgi:hypothetical protein